MIEQNFMQKLLDGVKVEWRKLDEVVTTITAPSKVKKEIYCETGKIPIIDQGIDFIAGYTDEDFKPVKSDEYIIFGDHSEHIKFVDFAFVQGADGLKILKPKSDNARYIYYAFVNFYQIFALVFILVQFIYQPQFANFLKYILSMFGSHPTSITFAAS